MVKIAKLQNSVIILDEVQALPLEFYSLISRLVWLLVTKFKCKIIIATATYPLIINEGCTTLNRTKLINKTKKEMSINELIEEIIQIVNSSQSTLMICNTISEAKMIIEKLLQKINNKEYQIFYLSTHIIPKERKKRIKEIEKYIKKSKKVIVVSTQLIEAGIDLDFNTVIRDFAPFDSIIQAGGRCNRNNIEKYQGKIILYKVLEDGKNSVYAKKIYSPINLNITENLLSNFDEIDEKQYYSLINKYYSEIKRKRDSQSKGESVINLLKEWKLKEAVEKFELIKQQDKKEVFIILDNDSRELFEKFKFNWYNNLFGENKKMRSIMNEYVIEVYSKHVMETLLTKMVDDEEIFYIDKLKSMDKNFYQYDDAENNGVGFVCNADIII